MQDRYEKIEYIKTLLLWMGIVFGLSCFVMGLKGYFHG